VICNEQNKTIAQIWDGSTLMLTFRRNFSVPLMQQWYELEGIVSMISYSEECDSLIWQYETSGEYTTSSFYALLILVGLLLLFGNLSYTLECMCSFGYCLITNS
jgi:hypothetical protein